MWTASTELEPEKAYTPYILLRDIVHGGNKKAAFEEMKALLGMDSTSQNKSINAVIFQIVEGM